MKTIYDSHANSWTEYLNAFRTELQDKLNLPLIVVHNHARMQLMQIRVTDKDILMTFEYETLAGRQSSTYSLIWFVTHQTLAKLTLEDGSNELFADIGNSFVEACALHETVLKEEAKQQLAARLEAREAEKKAKAEAKRLEALEKKKARDIKDFEARTQVTSLISPTDEFYYSLGWLAKHSGTFAAALPDYLVPMFYSHFGTEYKPTVVDSRKRTINGYAMQWTLSMKASISSKAVNMPDYLTKYLSQNGKHIADTTFIWDLVDNYGFKFGKRQDLEAIKSHIPDTYINLFEAGLAA